MEIKIESDSEIHSTPDGVVDIHVIFLPTFCSSGAKWLIEHPTKDEILVAENRSKITKWIDMKICLKTIKNKIIL